MRVGVQQCASLCLLLVQRSHAEMKRAERSRSLTRAFLEGRSTVRGREGPRGQGGNKGHGRRGEPGPSRAALRQRAGRGPRELRGLRVEAGPARGGSGAEASGGRGGRAGNGAAPRAGPERSARRWLPVRLGGARGRSGRAGRTGRLCRAWAAP